ncbi:MAG: hypothetical protein ACP5KV_08170 [Candidatus Methanomethylicaceae archaeon]
MSGENKGKEYLNVWLPDDIAKRLNAYLMAVTARKRKIPHGLKTEITRMALKEWFDKHENDLDLF